MSIATCYKCDRYVDTDNEPMVESNGYELCLDCVPDEDDTE